uniref:CID domain-containing protein n=1 Tax=Meloidogyne javanica TaxID=6303 RepID=A0A915MC40_MELJA
MDSDVIKAFNKLLVSMQECKGGIVSKQKVVDITKAAMNAVRYFKHVVFIVERYLVKCRQEFKIPALYVMDSILRQAKKQYKHKDVFAPRFAVNLSTTINNVLDCDPTDRLKVVRVVNLWQAHQIFADEVIEPILNKCQASGLDVEPAKVERLVKGEKADMQLYQQSNLFNTSGNSIKSETVPTSKILTPHIGNINSVNVSASGQSLDERLSQFSRQKLGIGGRSNSTSSTTLKTELGPRTPPLEDHDHRQLLSSLFSDTKKEPSTPIQLPPANNNFGSGLSGAEVISLVQPLGFSLDHVEVVAGLQRFLEERVIEQIEMEKRRQGNIKNLLSRDFDYSDEEDEGGGGGHHHNGTHTSTGSPITLSSVSKEKLLNLARSVVAEPAHQEEMRKLVACVNKDVGIGSPAAKMAPQQLQQPLTFPMPNFSFPPPSFPNGTLFPEAENYRNDRNDYSRGDRRDSRASGSSRKRSRWSPVDEKSRSSRRDNDSTRHDEKSSSHRRRENDERSERSSHKRTRSTSPRKNDRERNSDKEKEREQMMRDRRRMGLPEKLKFEHVLIASRTLWFGRIPTSANENDIIESVKEIGTPEKIIIVNTRGCAYVTMPDRKLAFKIIDRMGKTIQLAWATIPSIKEEQKFMDKWDCELGFAEIPFSILPDGNLDKLMEGAWLELYTLPELLKDRYTNTGIKQAQQQLQAIQLPPAGLTLLPPQMAAGLPATAGQLMPGFTFPAALTAAMFPQMAAAASGATTTQFPPVFPNQAIQMPPPHMLNPSNQQIRFNQQRFRAPFHGGRFPGGGGRFPGRGRGGGRGPGRNIRRFPIKSSNIPLFPSNGIG